MLKLSSNTLSKDRIEDDKMTYDEKFSRNAKFIKASDIKTYKCESQPVLKDFTKFKIGGKFGKTLQQLLGYNLDTYFWHFPNRKYF